MKKRLWKQTIWEILLPLICGLTAGYISFTPNDGSDITVLQYFQQIQMVYLLALTLITISYAGSCTFILNQVVVDKETKMRETLKIMSASRSAYTFSYFLVQGFFVLITTLFVGFGMQWSMKQAHADPLELGAGFKTLFGCIFLFGLALISLSMALTTLFSDSKLSPQVGMYLLLLPTSIFFYVLTNRMSLVGHPDTLAYNLFPLTYLMPNFSFSVIMLQFYIKGGPKILMGLDVDVAWYCLAAATPFYLILYMYLDGIIPNAFGIRESLCFCLKRNKKPKFDQEEMLQGDEEQNELMNAAPLTIKMMNLSKKFGKFTACDKLNFGVHQNEVLCLLGHNGAGKTTCINMLTGMI